MSSRSLAQRIFLKHFLASLFVFLTLSVGAYFIARQMAVDGYISNASRTVDATAAIAPNLQDGRTKAADTFAKSLLDALDARRVTVFASFGAVLSDVGIRAGGEYAYGVPPEVLSARRTGMAVRVRREGPVETAVLHIARRLTAHTENENLVVRVSYRRAEILSGFNRSALILSYLVVGLLSAFAAYLWFHSRSYAESLSAVSTAARAYGEGDLSRRTAVPSYDAGLSEVARNLNEMAYHLSRQLSEVTAERDELEMILSNMVEGVILLDAATHIRSLNQAARKLFAGDGRDAEGRSLVEFTRNAEIDEFARRAMESREPVERTIAVYESEIVYLQLHGSALQNPAGKVDGVVLVLTDITRIKQLENMRKDFVANVSHELKTPITSILGFVETLRGGAIREPDRAERFLGIIAEHSHRLHMIVEDLLSLSRLESQGHELQREWVEIDEMVRGVMRAVSPETERKSIGLHRDCECATEAYVNTSLLQQAITNLVDNAIKYSDEGASVRIEVARPVGELRISVHDTGPGIPKRDLSRVFERFYRVDRARSRALGGTGLGLSIVKHIAQAHGGSVEARSEVGSGSTFTIRIPQQVDYAEAGDTSQSVGA